MNAVYRIARGVVLGLAMFGLLAHVRLLAGAALSALELPLALVAGLCASLFLGRREFSVTPQNGRAPWLLPWLFGGVVVFGVALVAYGAFATPARGWDGIVAWELKALALAPELRLANPLFADPSAFHHSPSYPLLQPLCVASLAQWGGAAGGRLLFPLLWLLFVGLALSAATRALAGDRTRGLVIGLAVATLPCFLNTSGGAADSGYAEMFFAVALTAVGAGLLLRDATMLASAALLLPLLKPEGIVLALGLPFVPFVLAERGANWWRAMPISAGLGIAVVYVTARALTLRQFEGGLGGLGVGFAIALTVALMILGLRLALDRLGMGSRGRLLVLTALALLALTLLFWLPRELASTALGQFVVGFERIGDKLEQLPAILIGLLQFMIEPRRFGLTFGLVVLLLVLRHRRLFAAPGHLLGAWLGIGALVVFAAFLLSPERDVEHHLRSSAPRLLSHWLGAIWLWIAAVWSAPASDPR